jgi:hypothetical protein
MSEHVLCRFVGGPKDGEPIPDDQANTGVLQIKDADGGPDISYRRITTRMGLEIQIWYAAEDVPSGYVFTLAESESVFGDLH